MKKITTLLCGILFLLGITGMAHSTPIQFRLDAKLTLDGGTAPLEGADFSFIADFAEGATFEKGGLADEAIYVKPEHALISISGAADATANGSYDILAADPDFAYVTSDLFAIGPMFFNPETGVVNGPSIGKMFLEIAPDGIVNAGDILQAGHFAFFDFDDSQFRASSGLYKFTNGSISVNEITDTPTDPVPEPTTLVLFGIGLVGLTGVNRKKRMK